MQPIEIIVIIGIVLILGGNIGVFIYKRIKHKPIGECSCCSNNKKAKRMFKSIKKDIDEECCCCKK